MDWKVAGGFLRELREAQGWSRPQLAAKTGLSESRLKRVEAGTPIDSVRDLERLMGAYGMTFMDLLASAERDGDPLDRLPKRVQALVLAIDSAAADAPFRTRYRPIAELADHLSNASRCFNDARAKDAAAILADVIPDLDAATLATRATEPGALLAKAYQLAALVLSHTGAGATGRLAAHSAIRIAPGDPAPILTAASVLRRSGRSAEARLMVNAAWEAIDSITGKAARAVRGAAYLELAALDATEYKRTDADAHLTIASQEAAHFDTDIELAGVWFGPTAVAVRQLDVAIKTGDSDLALRIASRIDSASQPALTKARLLIHTAQAHSLAGNADAAVRAITKVTALAPQLRGDPVVRRLLTELYTDIDNRHYQLHALDPRRKPAPSNNPRRTTT